MKYTKNMTRFFVNRNVAWFDRYEIQMRVATERDGIVSFAFPEPVKLRVRTRDEEDSGLVVAPMLAIEKDEAQSLMDELWQAGLRPTEGTGSAGSLAATERHLSDMKRVAFHALKIAP